MNQEGYSFVNNAHTTIYTFVSVGEKGTFSKVVIFQSLYQNLYNLILADYDIVTNNFDDKNITNNGDIVKILATVIKIIQDFTAQNPDAFVYIEGNTPLKQRLYNRIVTRNLPEIQAHYTVSGVLPNGNKEPFLPDTPYIAFILEPKLAFSNGN
jgi:hypothetical protein